MGPARVGLGCRSWPAGRVRVRVRVWKNLARTQPVAIPISSFDSVLNFSQGLENASFNALKPLEMDSGELSFNAFVKDIHEIGMRLVAEKVRETEIRKLESNFVWGLFFFFFFYLNMGRAGLNLSIFFWIKWGSMGF